IFFGSENPKLCISDLCYSCFLPFSHSQNFRPLIRHSPTSTPHQEPINAHSPSISNFVSIDRLFRIAIIMNLYIVGASFMRNIPSTIGQRSAIIWSDGVPFIIIGSEVGLEPLPTNGAIMS
ncbi:hypothetical protein LINGRAHAP2_LOCUS5436, partial [Linum grandiflorum]